MTIEQEIAQLARRRLILADSGRGRAEMARYLRSVGMEVIEASNAHEASEFVRSSHPDVLALDVETEGDPLSALRVAAEPRHGDVTRVLLTCRARTPRDRIASMVTPAVADIVMVPCRPEAMIGRLARVLRGEAGFAQRAAAAAATQAAAPPAPIAVCPSNSSLLQQSLLCRFHDEPVPTRRFALRQNRIQVEPNFFDVPVYSRAVGSSDYVDYHRVCVTVCPKCFFASPDPSYFLFPGDARHTVRPLTPSARYAILSRAHQRRQLLGDIADDFFSEFRSGVDAVKSYELALHCSTAMHGAARRPLSDELVRQGNYHLRIAHLQVQLGTAQREQDAHIEAAGRILREAFPALSEHGGTGPNGAMLASSGAPISESALARNTYQCVATSIYQGDDRAAQGYISRLARFRGSLRDPALRAAMNGYLARSVQAYEDRGQHRRPTAAPAVPFFAPFLAQAA